MGRCKGFFGGVGLKFTIWGFFGQENFASIFSGTINHLKAMVTQHNSAVWPVPYACAQPMSPNKDETALHGRCHCPGDIAV